MPSDIIVGEATKVLREHMRKLQEVEEAINDGLVPVIDTEV